MKIIGNIEELQVPLSHYVKYWIQQIYYIIHLYQK